jgi:hypothetical protein
VSAFRPLRLQVAGEKPVEGHPSEAGQAGMQMSIHARWCGYRWSNGDTLQPTCPLGLDLIR